MHHAIPSVKKILWISYREKLTYRADMTLPYGIQNFTLSFCCLCTDLLL